MEIVSINLQQLKYKMKISIGNDHVDQIIKKVLSYRKGHQITNYGTDSVDSVDYPDFGHPVATDVTEGKADLGIVICGRKRNCNVNKTCSKFVLLYVG
jgi:ribose 5-phosphate isomerase B